VVYRQIARATSQKRDDDGVNTGGYAGQRASQVRGDGNRDGVIARGGRPLSLPGGAGALSRDTGGTGSGLSEVCAGRSPGQRQAAALSAEERRQGLSAL